MPGPVRLHIDGAAKGNPGPAGIGLVARDAGGRVLLEHGEYIGETSNNVAEYTALIRGLTLLLERGVQEVQVASDSELLVRQIHGLYRVKAPHLVPLHRKAAALLARFARSRVDHVPREANREADALANAAVARRLAGG